MKKPAVILLMILAILAILYSQMPVIAYGFPGLPLMIAALAMLWILLNLKVVPQVQNQQQAFRLLMMSPVPKWILAGVILYMTALPLATSWSLFRWDDYRQLIGKVETGENLSNHMAPISIDKIRVVDESLAELLGDKVLGAQPALGSQVRLGRFVIQKVRNELYWVAPLLHSGFFKWTKNMDGSPGYVMVNACNERDVKLVQEVNGHKVRIKYQPEAYFGDFLERHLYLSGYWNTGLTDFSFEIDDDGNPFWVVTKYSKQIGFYGDDANGVVVINPETGQCTDYGISNAPAWIDRIQPEAFVSEQLNDWGNFVKGFWNFSNENKLKTTQGLSLVYGEDNRAYWYTGLTSVGSDEATVGFALVDTRTKKAVWYKQSGATEHAAQNSAMGKVQEKRYFASLPIPYNINNIPTYMMTLKDNGGLVKMFAMVAIEDYTIVGVGNTLVETLMAYKNAYNMAGNKINPKNATQKVVLKSVVNRIHPDIKNGNSFYYFTVEGMNNIFIGSSQISNEMPVTMVGDSISISFDNDTSGLIDISAFKNISLTHKK
ncbi:MAG: hypothetical protein LWW85_12005 [Marinilabiliales bacterium]|nr:hypothetical protein [Marinilabiliales bacterium]